ncbi:hypothetical protein NP493_373g02056 [Ridgeia piscesae]|uniref:VWFA domain-containing protein n=1 Tax=Ridgeia piscesae TaxID=27915 RepID=A0AAD9NV75_RIDPI|nr:hypothetical protein NP493_373g02056 [Ridgeia piscesae]
MRESADYGKCGYNFLHVSGSYAASCDTSTQPVHLADVVDGIVWGPWSTCTKTCDTGTQQRLGYLNGTAEFVHTANCGVVPCHGPYEGSVWSSCSETCDSGERSRSNIYDNETQTIPCNTHNCIAYNGKCLGDIVIILDSSGSIVERNWFIEKQLAIDVIKGLKDLGESYDVDDIEATVWNATYMGGLTYLAEAIRTMRSMFNESGRADVKHIAIFVSDAVPNINFEQTIPEADAAKAEGVEIFFVGSGQMDYDMIVALASSPPEVYVMNVTDIASLQNLTQYIDNATCHAAFIPDCSKCDYSTGQIWMNHIIDCHAFIICQPLGNVATSCSSDMLLHFPFDDHFNDVTCNHAISTVYGGVSIENDTIRGNVACFNTSDHLVVAFMRNWFAGRDVDAFSIAVWVRREIGGKSKANIVSNGECELPSFHITTQNETLYGGITTDQNITLDGAAANNGEWHHAVWLYNGRELRFYIDGVLTESTTIEGFMANSDAAMHIGQCCGDGFKGCMDEVGGNRRTCIYMQNLTIIVT